MRENRSSRSRGQNLRQSTCVIVMSVTDGYGFQPGQVCSEQVRVVQNQVALSRVKQHAFGADFKVECKTVLRLETATAHTVLHQDSD